MLTPWKESYDQPRQHIQKQRHYFANKGPSSQGDGFSSGHVRVWELVYKESEHPRIDAFVLWCWRRFLRVPWTARRSNQSILNEISPGCSLVGLMLNLKLQYFGHLMQRADSYCKDPGAGKDWRQEEKGTTEDEMAEWRHRLNGDEFEKTSGVGDGQGGLACCSPWDHEESDMTELLNWTELSDLTNRHLFTHSSRDQTSEVKVPVNSLQSLPSEGAEREVPSCLFFFL